MFSALTLLALLFSVSYAQATQNSTPEMGNSFIFFLLLCFAIIYFLMIRPNVKKQKELDQQKKSLKKGDKIITSMGIIATIEKIKDEHILTIKISDTTSVDIVSSSVVQVLSNNPIKKDKK